MTINNMFITGGQFVAALIDGILSPYKKIGWRYKNFIHTYLLLTEFEVCTVSYALNFSPLIYGPSMKCVSRKSMVKNKDP